MDSDSKFDIIGIGDTLIDVFIKISDGHIQETANGTELCIPYGAKIPFESATEIPGVGNSANACVSASRLGMKTAIVTAFGNDNNGNKCIEHLEKEKVSTRYVTKHDGISTNYHYVIWYGDDRTILVKHAQFPISISNIDKPKWIYLSSLGAHTKDFHFTVVEYIKNNPDVKLAFQPGTFQLQFKHQLEDLYKQVNVVCMNKEEAEELIDMKSDNMKLLLDGLEELGPKIILITDGNMGAYMKYENTYFNMPIYPDIAKPLERTGAGDAFFSAFISYLAKGYDAAYAITRAPINSMSVVQHIGAQEGLLTEEKIEEYLKKAPDYYKLKILE